jgi:hypothetical protein
MEGQLIPLAQRTYPVRAAYVDAVVSVAQSTAIASPDLLRRLYQLLTQANLSREDRLRVLEKMFLTRGRPTVTPPDLPDKDTALSLVRDLLSVGELSDRGRADQLVSHLVARFGIKQEQIAFLESWTQWENRILVKLGMPGATVSAQDMPVELTKKATAVGVPVAALYFSGLVGFSAAGITSGLAAIGTTSGLVVLGLNPMTAGIVALIAGGIGVKKVLDAVIPSTQRDKVEAQLKQLIEQRGRCLDLLETDEVLFSRGSWREVFTRKGRCRKMAVRLLRELGASERAALAVLLQHRVNQQQDARGRGLWSWWPW